MSDLSMRCMQSRLLFIIFLLICMSFIIKMLIMLLFSVIMKNNVSCFLMVCLTFDFYEKISYVVHTDHLPSNMCICYWRISAPPSLPAVPANTEPPWWLLLQLASVCPRHRWESVHLLYTLNSDPSHLYNLIATSNFVFWFGKLKEKSLHFYWVTAYPK